MKEAVANTLQTLGLLTVVLHEQPNAGRTIIEKFTDYADVGFAVVLSADDLGRASDAPPKQTRPRARQNVIFELGYFIGKLGRNRVLALYQEEQNFEFPTDYQRCYLPPSMQRIAGSSTLLKELKAAGYKVDANRLI